MEDKVKIAMKTRVRARPEAKNLQVGTEMEPRVLAKTVLQGNVRIAGEENGESLVKTGEAILRTKTRKSRLLPINPVPRADSPWQI